jgi:hypothetical protein
MSLEGRIIEFLDAEQLRVAYVRRQDHDRLHVVDPRGRNLSVSGDRVVIVHRPVPESDFPAIARQITDKVSARQSEVDVELLWQSLGGSQREMEPSELAELFFAENSAEATSAVFRALSEDNLFFNVRVPFSLRGRPNRSLRSKCGGSASVNAKTFVSLPPASSCNW